MYSTVFLLLLTYGGPLQGTPPMKVDDIPSMSECIALKNKIKAKEKNIKTINCYPVSKVNKQM